MRRPTAFLLFLLRYGVIGVFLFVVFSNLEVSRASQARIYRETETVPFNQTGLLLGTSRFDRSGRPNPYFQKRIAAAATLHDAGRVDVILASGDNEHRSYNEPEQMLTALLDAGIPREDILLDYAGYRTLDSVVRAGRVFGQKRFTVISQPFHLGRALFIAREFDLEVVAFAAEDVGGYAGLAMSVRESLARALAVLDVHVLRTQPRSLSMPAAAE